MTKRDCHPNIIHSGKKRRDLSGTGENALLPKQAISITYTFEDACGKLRDYDCREWGGGRKMAELTGLEPATSRVTGERSNQLNYGSVWTYRWGR